MGSKEDLDRELRDLLRDLREDRRRVLDKIEDHEKKDDERHLSVLEMTSAIRERVAVVETRTSNGKASPISKKGEASWWKRETLHSVLRYLIPIAAGGTGYHLIRHFLGL
jgi:hypothetical protein